MDSTNGSLHLSDDKIAQLEAEVLALRQENERLRSERVTAFPRLKEQVAAGKRETDRLAPFESVFEQSILGNKIIAPDLSIIQVNKALEQMLGYSQEELIGSKITAFSHPDFIHQWQELRAHLWSKQIPAFQIEACLIRKDGSVLWCQVTSILFLDQDEALGYTIVEDINVRKVLELELKKQYEKQETIMHMVAHDLKNPLYNIKLAAELLKGSLEQLHTEAEKKKKESFDYVASILDTSDRAFDIIADLLLIGEVDSSLGLVEEINLKNFIRHYLNNYTADAQRKGIEIVYHFPDEPVFARIALEKFMRVLENLLSNAVKFSEAGGQVSVTLQKEGDKAVLQVHDNGIGIPEELQASLFDKFTTARRTGTAGETTTGLGLYIVKQIVQKYNGRVWVESQENAGTTFFVELV